MFSQGQRKEYRLHKVILANHSDFFQAAFDSNLYEAHQSKMELHFEDEKQVLPLVFEYMYTTKIEMNAHNVIAVLNAAQFLQIAELIQLATDEFEKVLGQLKEDEVDDLEPKETRNYETVELILELWRDAAKFSLSNVMDSVHKTLVRNFDLLSPTHDFSFLPYEAFYAFVSDSALIVEDEFKYHSIIAKYVEKQSKIGDSNQSPASSFFSSSLSTKIPSFLTNALSEEQIQNLFKAVAFEKLSVEQVETIVQAGIVPQSILISGLMNALKSSNGIPVQSVDRPSRVRKCRKSQTFTYESDFDQNGIIYYLGTQGHKKAFTNPQDSSLVKCEMSSILIGSPANLTARSTIPTSTRSQDPEWICIDFGGSVTVRPSAYTIMHGSKSDRCVMRDWAFEGSMDKQNWTTISKHKRDSSLVGSFGTHTWQFSCDEHFRYFRITTRNFFIQVSGFEIYGEMKSDYFV